MQNDFGLLNDKEFRKHVEDLGGQVVISQVASFGNLDYRSELTKIKEAHVDGIYFVLNGAHLSQTTKQALELEIDLPYFGMYGTESSDMLALGGTSLEGLIYTFTLPDEKNFTEKQKKFLEDFAKTTGWIPQAAAYGAYDIYDMLLHGFDHCEENNEPSCVGTFIKSHTWDGVSGKYWYEGNEVKRDLYLKIIQNGKFQQYSP